MASDAWRQIEPDLGRTCSRLTALEKKSLRRVLRSYALRNPAVGYCQALNFVALALLRASEGKSAAAREEDAFWLLAAVCEDIAPYYYVPSMAGVTASVAMLETLFSHRMPVLLKHLRDLSFPLELVAVQWLVGLFASALPMETVYRAWDVLFLEGADTLFFLALALFR